MALTRVGNHGWFMRYSDMACSASNIPFVAMVTMSFTSIKSSRCKMLFFNILYIISSGNNLMELKKFQ